MQRHCLLAVVISLTALGAVACSSVPSAATPSTAATQTRTTPTAGPTAVARASNVLLLATTTSTQDSGLLTAILPAFEKQYNVKVNVVAVGTGQAIKIGSDGNADVVLVHDRKAEDVFVASGDGVNRRDVMYNDFVLVGPTADPGKIKGLARATEAFKRIADSAAAFASRGDKSGTNAKELAIWSAAGVEPKGAWYLSLGQGMGETLTFANERGAYTLADRATWIAQKSRLNALSIVVGGNSIVDNTDGENLFNPYGVISVNPKKHAAVNADLAEKFSQWLISEETQQAIAKYGLDKYGQALFRPSAKK